MVTKRSRRASLAYQNLCMMPRTQKTRPCAFMKRLRALARQRASPVCKASATASAAIRPDTPLLYLPAGSGAGGRASILAPDGLVLGLRIDNGELNALLQERLKSFEQRVAKNAQKD